MSPLKSPLSPEEIFRGLCFAKKTIGELEALKGRAPHKIIFRSDHRAVTQHHVFPSFRFHEVDLMPRQLVGAPISFRCIAEKDEYFGAEKEFRGEPGKHTRGLVRLDYETCEPPHLVFNVHVNDSLCPHPATAGAAERLRLRSETIAAEFLAAWFIREQIQAELDAGETWAQIINGRKRIPQRHAEDWEIHCLLCPIATLRQRLRAGGLLPVGAEAAIEFFQNVADWPLNDSQRHFLMNWERDERVSQATVKDAIESYLYEDIFANAWRGSEAAKRVKVITPEFIADCTINPYLGQLWDRANEWLLSEYFLKLKVANWQQAMLRAIVETQYWASANGRKWGSNFF